MYRAMLKFKASGSGEVTGECTVDVDTKDMKEIWAKAQEKDFSRFVTKTREMPSQEWSFELVGIEEIPEKVAPINA